MDARDEQPQDRILHAFRRLGPALLRHFDYLFVIVTLVAVGAILYFLDEKLSFLNFFFIPVLLAGYFVNARSAVLGALLAVGWVSFFAVLDPLSFGDMTRMALFLHILSWGSFLVLSGALVGRLSESLRDRLEEARKSAAQLDELHSKLAAANQSLEGKNRELELNKGRVEAVLYSAMAPELAKLILEGRLKDETRDVSVLLAGISDFEGATKDMPPESILRGMNQMFSSLEPVLVRYKGHLDRFTEDGFQAEFGMPLPAGNHPLLATLAALQMRDSLRDPRSRWRMRMGISSGPSLVGLVGSESRKNYTVLGDRIALASRLSELCPPGAICVDETTHRFVRRWFMTRQVRDGLDPEETKTLAARVELLGEVIRTAPTAALCMEAAELCSQLGDVQRMLQYQQTALELDPALRRPVERAVASAVLTSPERAFLSLKGVRRRFSAFEVIALRDPVEDGGRLPARVIAHHRALAPKVPVPEVPVLAVEALAGSVGHARLTAAISACLADAMGLDEKAVRTAFLAGYLHDVGNRSVPEPLLSRSRMLEELPAPDQELLKGHVREAEKVLSEWGTECGEDVLRAIRQHHERPDGSGYPEGLTSEAISLTARVIAFGDTYEFLTSWRPYRSPIAPVAALQEMRQQAEQGKLDGRIADVFFRLMQPGASR